LDLFSDATLLKYVAGRASAEIVGDVSIGMSGIIDTSAVVFQAGGFVAVRPTGANAPSSVAHILSLPGHATLGLSPFAPVSDRVLQFPPLVRRNVLVQSVIGRDPIVYAYVNGVGYSSVHLTLTGMIELSGVGTLELW
jgi:hypothetical protein